MREILAFFVGLLIRVLERCSVGFSLLTSQDWNFFKNSHYQPHITWTLLFKYHIYLPEGSVVIFFIYFLHPDVQIEWKWKLICRLLAYWKKESEKLEFMIFLTFKVLYTKFLCWSYISERKRDAYERKTSTKTVVYKEVLKNPTQQCHLDWQLDGQEIVDVSKKETESEHRMWIKSSGKSFRRSKKIK